MTVKENIEINCRYSKRIRIPYPECDIHNQWKLSYIMRAIQQAASDQLDDLGITFRKLYAEGYVFLLSKEYIELHKGISAGDEVIISTWPIPPKGAQFRRNITIESLDGVQLMSAYTAWLLVNPKSHKILRPLSFPYTLNYAPLNESDPMEEQITSLKPPFVENCREGVSLKVSYSNSDCNGHLNNAVYGDLVLDCIPFEIWEEYQPSAFLIHFIKEAKIGSEVFTTVGWAEGQQVFNGIVCLGKNQKEKCFQASLKLKHIENGFELIKH